MKFKDQELGAWVAERTKGWKPEKLSTVKHLTEADWAAVRLITQEFGSLWGKDEEERNARERAIGRFMRNAEPVVRDGVSYAQPYSLGLHYAALDAAGNAFRVQITDEPLTPIVPPPPSTVQKDLGYGR